MYVLSRKNKQSKSVFLHWCGGHPEWTEKIKFADTYDSKEEAEANAKVVLGFEQCSQIINNSQPIEILEIVIKTKHVKKGIIK